MKQFINAFLILTLLIPSLGFARNKTTHSTKRCGDFTIVDDVAATDGVYVCREDSGVMDDGYKTVEGKTIIHTTKEISSAARSSAKIIDEILLIEIKKRALKKLENLNVLDKLPDSEQSLELRAHVKKFKDKILDDSHGALHQIRTILTVYPDIADDLSTQFPEYETLLCKYENWKHKREVLSDIAVLSSKIMSYTMLLAGPLGGAAFFGFFSIQAMGSILIGLGVAEASLGGFELATTIRNWDDVRAGSIAKQALIIDKSLKEYIQTLQKDPKKNEKEILGLQVLRLSPEDVKDLKDLKKAKATRIKQVIGSSLKIIAGAASIRGGIALKAYFKDFKTTEPAQVINEPVTGTGTNPLPGSGGNDPGNGFPMDDGG